MKNALKTSLFCLAGFLFMHPASARPGEAIVGAIRIQALSENLVRIEQKGLKGFENRNTFTVVDRSWPGVKISVKKREGRTVLSTSKCLIEIPDRTASLEGILVSLKNGKDRVRFKGLPPPGFFPGPACGDQIWILPDGPRMVPPEWGAAPPPDRFRNDPCSGWDIANDAQDVYVFLLEPGRYENFRSNFLKLTGPVPMPPLFTFGLWDSRYHPYTEETALETIGTYRKKRIPLDVFVVDTDWRVGASHGYGINDTLFPDMRRFIERAHERRVRLMFNDHPEPRSGTALDPAELMYRWDGLTGLFDMGIDVWWYDRNWVTGLHEPMPGISKEVWGMRLYHDITRACHPGRRPLIMSNVDGIDNGIRNLPSHPASHRFPIWWTGDQKSKWEFLEMGVANGVDSGIERLMPYVHEDLGGHTEGNPDPDQYVRWVQFGAFSPVARLHCTRGLTRFPWEYGEEAERIASEYIRMRYRLLPVLYAAARRAYENGTPLMRRCDLEWPGEPEAGRNKQFLFGEDLLVAPVALAKTRDIAPAPGLFRTSGGERGLSGEYFDNKDLKGDPVLVRTDTALNFVWGTGGPDPRIPSDRFSVRWTGTICPPGGDGQPRFKVVSDDGVRVWIDGTLVVDAWQDQAPAGYPITMNLEPGRPYPIRIEFYENAGGAHFQFLRTVDVEQVHQVWIPPGDWQDIWTGRMLRGPATTVLKPVLWKCPVYVRNGGIVFSVPQMQVTDEHPWNKVIVDAFVPLENASRITRILYEDDGLSPGYQNGAFCKTPVTLSRNGKKIRLAVHGMQGNFAGAISSRDWVVRLNLPRDGRPENVRIDGRSADPVSPDEPVLITETELQEDAMPFTGAGGKPRSLAGPILEMTLHQGNTREEVHVSFQLARNGTQKQE